MLGLGSLTVSVAPVSDRQADLPGKIVGGMRYMSETGELPAGWPAARARAVRRLARAASLETTINALLDGSPQIGVSVNEALLTGVERALRATHASFGSLVGHLRDLADRQRLTATLVLSTGDEVAVDFTEDQDNDLRSAWRHHRVEATGYISEGADGTPIRLRLRSIEVLPTDSTLTSGDVTGGFYPEITGDLDVDEYLASMRGTA